VKPSVKELRFNILLPEGLELNAQAPSQLEVHSLNSAVAALTASPAAIKSTSLTVPVNLHPGQTSLNLDLTLFYCSHGQEALCYFKQASFTLPITVSDQGALETLTVNYLIQK
jgi:hypothetical protein